LHSVTLGFSPRDVVTGRLQTQPGGDRGLDRATYSRDLLTQLRSVPAVESAALCHLFPASIVNTQEVAAADLPTTGIATAFEQVSPGFFGTVRISLLAGRDFTWTDDATGKAVAVISADLASRLFPRGDALSREIRIGASPSEQAVQVVGIVNAVHFGNVRNDAPPVVFRPLLQEPRYQIIPVLVVRSAAGRPLPADDIRRIVAAAGHEFAPDLTTLDKQISQFILQERMLAVLAIAFAGLAALLGFLGLFASLAHGVVNRTREIGVRVALGADTLTIIRMIVSQGLRVSVIGVVAGLPLALAAGQLARTFLFGLSPFDPTALISSAVAFLIIGCLAGVLPARRAARINPVDSLGSE
jgi:ABC-type antimicrobial peptide transport system permease subunit